MGMRTRRGYLGFLVASVLTATVGGALTLSTGCGGGTPENTIYQGSYGEGEWLVNGTSNANRYETYKSSSSNRTLSFTVNQKGRILGNYTSLDGTIYGLDGEIDNSGKFSLTATSSEGSFQVKGYLSHQQVPQSSLTTGEDAFAPGVAGNFTEIINGTSYDGSFYASGGLTTTSG